MRCAQIDRKTRETDIKLYLNLDEKDASSVKCEIGFMEHMLELFASHSGFGIKIVASGDIQVDAHHTVEDIGIALGKAIAIALGDKKGIKRYSSVTIPMDESMANVTIDLSGRPYLVFNGDLDGKCGDFDMELIEEFYRAVASNGGITLHVNILYGTNRHHMAEATFKAFARALAEAVKIVGTEIPSSKGMLE